MELLPEELKENLKGLLRSKTVEEVCDVFEEDAIKIAGARSANIILHKERRNHPGTFAEKLIKKNKFDRITILPEDEPYKLAEKENGDIVVIPLKINDDQLGALVVLLYRNEKISADVLDLLEMYSTLAALMIQKITSENEAQKAIELRDRFISLASHELRTPLTSINGYIQLLYSKFKGKNSIESKWIEELFVEGTRLTTLIKEILDVNRIKQGQFAFVLSQVSLKEVIEKAAARYRMTHDEWNIILNDEIKDKNYSIIGDFDKLMEMTCGLLSNAIKFSRPYTKIFVTLKRTRNNIHIIVRDEGKGMTKEEIGQVFDGFYKNNLSSKEGMGLGLLLAKHIIDHHKGKIEIRSKENKGTIVEVSLPIIKNPVSLQI